MVSLSQAGMISLSKAGMIRMSQIGIGLPSENLIEEGLACTVFKAPSDGVLWKGRSS